MTEDLFPVGPMRLSELPSEPPDGPFGSERSAAMIRGAALRGRDAPEQNIAPATLASLGASMLPLSGIADAFGYMPDFRGGHEPSGTKLFNQPGLEGQKAEVADDNSSQFDRCWGTTMSYKNSAGDWQICSYGAMEDPTYGPDGSRSFTSPSPIMVHNTATGEYRVFIGSPTITVTRAGKLTGGSPI